MSDIKSYQRLLAVQALYETSINTTGLDTKFEDLVSHIVDNVDFKNKIKDKKLLLTEEIYKGVLSNLKKNFSISTIALVKTILKKNYFIIMEIKLKNLL